MWKDFVREYLNFSKRDRNGILVLLALIVVLAILPYCWPDKKPINLSPEELTRIRELNRSFKSADSGIVKHQSTALPVLKSVNSPHSVFYFDPNSLDEPGWLRLGVSAKTASTIMHYRQKGGRFNKPEDLQHIYGLKQDDYERLLHWVRIARSPSHDSAKYAAVSFKNSRPAQKERPLFKRRQETVDINAADTAAFIALPGIGSALAGRIIRFRDRLGGFYSVKQVAETFGLPDSTFQLIEPMLTCPAASLRQINVNEAGLEELKQHPYIRWALANAIFRYRSQHGNFHEVNDLLNIHLMDTAQLGKLKPYLSLQ